jgi:Mn-dependent DtxR family transcriptional regulator
MTQELIASMLGVRRKRVTEAAGKLQKAGLIQCRRGHIGVLDRPELEAEVCDCYAVVKREYDRLLRSKDGIGNAGAHLTCGQYSAGC